MHRVQDFYELTEIRRKILILDEGRKQQLFTNLKITQFESFIIILKILHFALLLFNHAKFTACAVVQLNHKLLHINFLIQCIETGLAIKTSFPVRHFAVADNTSTSTTKGHRGCAWKSSLLEANWDRQAGKRAQVSIGMHAHPKTWTSALPGANWYSGLLTLVVVVVAALVVVVAALVWPAIQITQILLWKVELTHVLCWLIAPPTAPHSPFPHFF